MLAFDGCDHVLVTNPFADDSSTISSHNNHDILVSLTLKSSSDHPLRSRSVSPEPRSDTPNIPSISVVGSDGKARPRLMPLLSFDNGSFTVSEEGQTKGSTNEAPSGSGGIIKHPVRPNDSFAGVALRYGVSIAALRRANQLWPSDPIHLRTELVIPHGDGLRVRRKPSRTGWSTATLPSMADPTPSPLPDPVASSFIAARNKMLSVLPARISMDSLSSKASASEDHELDDFHKTRARRMPVIEAPFAEDGLELSILDTPHVRHVPLLSHTDNHQHVGLDHISPVRGLDSRPISSLPAVSLERPRRSQPFAVLPVRTCQLEPEPAMELPVRRSRTQPSS